jgi:serine/threonine protein kinase
MEFAAESCDVCEMWDCECGKADQSSKHDGDTSDGVPKPAESVVSLDDLKSQLSGDISTQEVTPDSSEQSESPQEQKDRQKDALAALLDDVLDDYIPPPKQPSPQPSPPQSPQKKATVASPGKPQLTIKPPPKLNFKKTQAQPASEPSEPSTPMTPSTPGTPSKRSTMQDFNIITVLGRGSYGKVVKARRKATGDIIAIKTMHKEELKEHDVLEWVEQERMVIDRIEKNPHPFVTKVEESFRTKALIVCVMEFHAGGDLGFHLKNTPGGKFSERRTKFYFAEVALAVNHLHRNGIIYRDMKPENVLLSEEGHCVLADFGFAKCVSPKDPLQHAFCGSQEFLAPEMINHDVKPYSYEVDWWSLAVTFYNLVTGDVPWTARTAGANYDKICEDPLPQRTLTDPCFEFLGQMLDKDLGKRLCTFDAIKNHPYMSDIEWEKLEKKEIKPPFIPDLDGDDTKYFAEEFTTMNTRLSIANKKSPTTNPNTPKGTPKTKRSPKGGSPKTKGKPKTPKTPNTGGRGKF